MDDEGNKGLCKHSLATLVYRCLDLVAIVDGKSRQRDQMRQAIDHLVFRLFGDVPQHPLDKITAFGTNTSAHCKDAGAIRPCVAFVRIGS